ncbi:class I SAM-dependent methyltransferase [Flavihumibacter petaseus]|uniref:Putative methyltransferase n=1 Tax=Flavihumibacter petaseus NBRC 106054 TaxID=1220578 RepID=A0A0E9MW91_9BACT|nr:class I SAM-dependent methyltransferase [Flavihumibacter petaseus]GAO41701.1 putative methyltransferase [Flavihumibacter petaseus NBRC 106054]
MTSEAAISLLQHEGRGISHGSNWIELGAGNGVFTRALANCLKGNSKILAIDRSISGALREIQQHGVAIETLQGDFNTMSLPEMAADGILIANAIHYVVDKKGFLSRWADCLQPGGVFCLVEYDTSLANQWVPYPVPAADIGKVFEGIGFGKTDFINRVASRYHKGGIYSVLARRG